MASSAKLISGPIASTLIGLSAPMLLGILSMMSFSLIDTFFISRLGTLQLAALTLTFPVAMVIATFTLGIGVGAMAVNVLGRPYDSLVLELILAFGLWIPFSLAGAHFADITGVFFGLSFANIIAGAMAFFWAQRVIRKEQAVLASA